MTIERYQPSLTCDGDGDWDYACPKCYQPNHPCVAGRGRPCPPRAPKIEYRTDGTREWFAVTCGMCDFNDPDPQPEPVYAR